MAVTIDRQGLLALAFDRFDGIIFDMDGTLLDSMGIWYQIDVDFLKKRGIVMDRSYNDAVKTMKLEEAADYTIRRYGLDEAPQAIVQEWIDMATYQYRCKIPMKAGALDLLKELSALTRTGKDGRVKRLKLSLATVSIKEFVEAAFQAHPFGQYFDAVEDVTKVSRGKDSPELYLKAAGDMGLEAGRCLVVEDALQGIQTASAAGFLTCAVDEALARPQIDQILKAVDYYLPHL